MKRVLVLGSSGSGKSTFARRLGEKLGLEVIHLDSHFWLPNWTNEADEEWDLKLKELLERDSWVMDGNYPSSLPQRLEYADTVVFLDYGRIKCLWRCVGRYLKHRGRNRPELAPGCYEKIDWDFFKWIWNYPRNVRPNMLAAINGQSKVHVIILKGDLEVNRFFTY